MTNMRAPIFVRLGERGWGQAVPTPGMLRKVTISNLDATGAEWTSVIMGVPRNDVADISLSNVRISGQGGGEADLLSRTVPEREREYPDAARFQDLPAHGLYCRHVRRLRLERVALTASEPDDRPALVLDDVRDSAAKDIAATPAANGGAVVWLRSAEDCLLRGIRSAGARPLIRLSGATTARVRVAADSSQPVMVVCDRDVPATAVLVDERG
jgi:hypothetical protein